MEGCVSFPISWDGALNQIFKCICGEGYIRTIKKNLKALEQEIEKLIAHQEDVRNRVEREEAHHQERLRVVELWLKEVDKIDKKVINVFRSRDVQVRKLCLFGLCSKNACSSYKYGKEVFSLLEQVKELKSRGEFEVVTKTSPRSEVDERPTRCTIGQDKMLERAWSRLMDDEVGIMGLHGMGGVGKTTLFNKIHNKLIRRFDSFCIVIWIVVSQGAKISKIQEDIARKLNLYNEDWEKKNVTDKAADINRVLKWKRFVLMLDDIWEKVDLEAIGVPFPSKENECKVAFTTRSQDVCGHMGDHKSMQVTCLKQDEAWELFKDKVGEDTLRRDPLIIELARKVANECLGLPLALCVIGEAMASKTMVQEWEHTIYVLSTNAADFSDMKDKILPILKYSYDNLVDEHIKSCFLYCALFLEDFKMEKEKLIDYWICEGFIGDYGVIKQVRNKGYTILGTLIRENLLLEVDSERVVMHDVVRDLALWIASDYGKQKENFIVKTRVGLHEIPEVKDQEAVRRMSLMDNKIEDITFGSNYSELITLFLQKNQLKNLSGDFILSMQKLVVLDLSRNSYFSELPDQISEMASLQYLNLSWTDIKKLPVGLLDLENLTHLDLSWTEKLCSLAGISKLLNLRILKLLRSKVHGDDSLVKELQLLKGLQVLTITVSTELGLELISDYQQLARCITDLEIRGFLQKPFDISLLASMDNLCALLILDFHSPTIDRYIKCEESKTDSSDLHSPTISCFTNLSRVTIFQCNGMKDLTWLLFAPKLVSVHIMDSEEVEEIINKEKATNLNLTGIIPFQKQEAIILWNLPKLESIYWNHFPFPFLKKMIICGCPKLKKLPLNATSVPQVEELEIKLRPIEQKTDFEWEDEATKDRFLPLITEFDYQG